MSWQSYNSRQRPLEDALCSLKVFFHLQSTKVTDSLSTQAQDAWKLYPSCARGEHRGLRRVSRYGKPQHPVIPSGIVLKSLDQEFHNKKCSLDHGLVRSRQLALFHGLQPCAVCPPRIAHPVAWTRALGCRMLPSTQQMAWRPRRLPSSPPVPPAAEPAGCAACLFSVCAAWVGIPSVPFC